MNSSLGVGNSQPRQHITKWWKEVILILSIYGVYTATRNMFGSAYVNGSDIPVHAFNNAMKIIRLERVIGLFHEETIQQWFLPYRIFIQFLNRLEDEQIALLLSSFWEEKKSLVHADLVHEVSRLKKEGAHVVVVSASPELFIKTFCVSLGVDTVLGSELKVLNNKYSLLINCRGEEKLKRIKRALPDFEIIAAYSDNKDDDVLLKIAKNGV